MTSQRPRPDDAVLGGQSQAPLDAAVLGGIAGVRQKLASDNEAVKKEGVLQALNYGEKGIEALFGVLEQERSEDVQLLAYRELEKMIEGDRKIDNRSWWGKLWGKEGAEEDNQGLDHEIKQKIRERLKKYFSWYEYESVTVNRQGEIIKRTPGRAKCYREDLGNGVYLDMVYIAGGSFLMGAPPEKFLDREQPQHRVTVPEFWMGKHQVTQAQWKAIMGDNPARIKGANRPVEHVIWDMCKPFCGRISERTGKRYRLPSEAEWEYACRAGTTTPFNCGETITTDLANYNGNYTYGEEGEGQYRKKTVDVGSFPPNEWGLYDMHGNVWEWCQDLWHKDYNGAPTDGSAWTDYHFPGLPILRGGSWYNDPWSCRSSNRDDAFSDLSSNCIGFRVLCESPRLP